MNGGGVRVALSYEHEQRMFEKSPGRGGGKTAGLCRRQQFLIFIKYRIGKRNVGLDPWRAPPDEAFPLLQNGVRSDLPVV